MKTSERTLYLRKRHHEALKTLSTDPNADGLKLWRKLRQLEKKANDACTANCNGEAYNGQPFIPNWHPDGSEGTPENPTPWEKFKKSTIEQVRNVLGQLPEGFVFNDDPRGYTFQIDRQKGHVPEGMGLDFVGNGIIAPIIED